MTLDKLAQITAGGFASAGERFASLEKSMTAIKEDIKEIKVKLTEHDARFSKLDYQIEEIHEILERFEEGDILDLQKRIKFRKFHKLFDEHSPASRRSPLSPLRRP